MAGVLQSLAGSSNPARAQSLVESTKPVGCWLGSLYSSRALKLLSQGMNIHRPGWQSSLPRPEDSGPGVGVGCRAVTEAGKQGKPNSEMKLFRKHISKLKLEGPNTALSETT